MAGRNSEVDFALDAGQTSDVSGLIYDPIDTSRKQIRLCLISTEDDEDTVQCSLSVAQISDSSTYRCLSYVWGASQEGRKIALNGVEYPVTDNLHAALRQLRRSDMRKDIWIDALCINQHDDVEKNEQVAMMGEIYSEAHEVLVWLGPQAQQAIFTGLDSAHVALVKNIMGALVDDKHFHELPVPAQCQSRRCPSISEHDAHRPSDWYTILASLDSIFGSPWFDRLWTVQEIVLARKAILLYGSVCLPWETVSKAWQNYSRHMRTCCTECVCGLDTFGYQTFYRICAKVLDLTNAKRNMERGQDIVQPLLQFSGRRSSDPRDRLYGLLGLQTGPSRIMVVPDYRSSLRTIFSRFAADAVTSQGWLLPLCLNLDKGIEGLPSWVPDWTVQHKNPVLYAINRFGWSCTYDAARGLEGCPKVDINHVLAVNGINFGFVRSTGPVYQLSEHFEDQLDVLDAWKDLVDIDVHGVERYTAGDSIEDAFWRTMTANRWYKKPPGGQPTTHETARLKACLEDTRQQLQEDQDNAFVDLNDGLISLVVACLERRFFCSNEGYFGLCPKSSTEGDRIFILGNCPVPVILRPVDPAHPGTYTALGHCYAHGIMNGEAVALDLPRLRIFIK